MRKQTIVAGAVAAVLALAAVGCGGGDDDETAGTTTVATTVETETETVETETETETVETETTETETVDTEAGAGVFADAGCGSCHTLAAADASGSVGPSLDESTLDRDAVVETVRDGRGGMPPFADTLSEDEIEDVAEFVVAVRQP